jgi:CHAD domain-containing protein
MSRPTEHREVELKFRVSPGFDLPDLVGAGAVTSVVSKEPFVMTAVYHDTDALSLFRWRTTLRRREGGADEGWHLKLPVAGADETSRDEVRMPLSAGPIGAVPAALVDVIAPLARGEALTPQVTVRTVRTPHLLINADGEQLLELVVDAVSVLDDSGQVSDEFHEVEVEMLDHLDTRCEQMLERVVASLLAAGAVPGSTSKAASALGPRASAPPDIPPVVMPRERGLAADAIRSAIATHVRHLLFADVAVRRDLPDSVHQMRVAARRLRSVLKTFAPLLDGDWASSLGDELAWLAAELGAIRDTEVLLARLDLHALELRGDEVATPGDDAELAQTIIESRLGQRLANARSGALAALRSDRHEWLLEDLVQAAQSPSVSDEAYRPCEEVLPSLVARTWHSLEASVHALEVDGPSEAWHRARIKAKRARYAADAVAPVFGKAFLHYASMLAEVTESLGEHQDAAVAQLTVRALATSEGVDGRTGFALGRLHEIEVHREVLSRYLLLDSWHRVQRMAKRTGLARRGH